MGISLGVIWLKNAFRVCRARLAKKKKSYFVVKEKKTYFQLHPPFGERKLMVYQNNNYNNKSKWAKTSIYSFVTNVLLKE